MTYFSLSTVAPTIERFGIGAEDDPSADRQQLLVPEGQTATIIAEVMADPCPSVVWMLEGEVITFINNTAQIRDDPCSGAVMVGVFSFNFSLAINLTTTAKASVMDLIGCYTATFSNSAGSASSDSLFVGIEGVCE